MFSTNGLGQPDEARVATLKKQLSDRLDVYDKILAKQPYIGGQVKIQRKIN